MEPLLLEQAAADLRLEVKTNRQPDGSQIYLRRGLLGCSRDADIYDPQRGPGALETKCCFDYKILMQEWDGGKTPPRQHEIQLQQQMYVGDGEKPFEWGTIALWCGGDMTYFHRKPMPDLWAKFEQEPKEFFADVRAGREPEPFGSPIEVPLLKQMFAKPTGEIINAPRSSARSRPPSWRSASLMLSISAYSGSLPRRSRRRESRTPRPSQGCRRDRTAPGHPREDRAPLKPAPATPSSRPPSSVKAHIPQQIDGGFGGI
jgi:hypothetical protein